MHKILLFFFLFSALFGCGQEARQKVFRTYLADLKTDNEYKIVKSRLKDSLQSWIDRGLYEVLFLKKVDWQIDDAVFFDKKKEKALLLILVRVKDAQFPDDYVKTIGAEKVGGSWLFYYVSYPVTLFRRADNNEEKYSFHFLSEYARNDLNEDGFIKCSLGCKINYSYVDSDLWFQDWERQFYVKFINGQMPKDQVAKPGEKMF